MLSTLIAKLQVLDKEASAEEVADALWLALQMRSVGTSRRPEAMPSQDWESGHPMSVAGTKIIPETPNRNLQRAPDVESSAAADINITDSGSREETIRIPRPSALPGRFAIARGLRPLRRRIPSFRRFVVDEQRTAEHLASGETWALHIRPETERWLDLIVVVDDSSSMQWWRSMLTDFKQLLERHGTFRDVKFWHLRMSKDGIPQIRTRRLGHRPITAITDPTGRRVIMVLSDFVSQEWRSGQFHAAVDFWAARHITVLCTPLPDGLHDRTALGSAEYGSARGVRFGTITSHLIFESKPSRKSPSSVQDVPSQTHIPVPLVTIETGSLTSWSRMVAGTPQAESQAVRFRKGFTPEPTISPHTMTGEMRLAQFYAHASPMAQSLAEFFANAPLTPPIMRMIQQAVLPESKPHHLAEFFLGGLIYELSPGIDDPDSAEYEYYPGIRDQLKTLTINRTAHILELVVNYIMRPHSSPLDFKTMLSRPNEFRNVLDKGGRSFATITLSVLERMGGKYATFAQHIRQEYQNSNRSAHTVSLSQQTTSSLETPVVIGSGATKASREVISWLESALADETYVALEGFTFQIDGKIMSIDVVVITRRGVWVIDALAWSGPIEVSDEGLRYQHSWFGDLSKQTIAKATALSKTLQNLPAQLSITGLVVLTSPSASLQGAQLAERQQAIMPLGEDLYTILISTPDDEATNQLKLYEMHNLRTTLRLLRSDPTPRLLDNRFELGPELQPGAGFRLFTIPPSEPSHRCLIAKRYSLDDPKPEEVRLARRRAAQDWAVYQLLANVPTVPVLLYHSDEIEKAIWSVWELWPGNSLHTRLPLSEPLSLVEQLRIVVGITECLSQYHQRGVVHGSLRPEAVWLTFAGRVQLWHFEHARVSLLHQPEPPTELTSYLPPEIINRTSFPEPSSDLFSLGAIWLELAAGSAALQDLSGALQRVSLSSSARQILRALLEPDPSRRPQDATLVLNQLRSLSM